MEIYLKIVCKVSQKYSNFYFMLKMFNLILVSVENVWERFWSPTASKNHQKSHAISQNQL